jgi:hypothetical protein
MSTIKDGGPAFPYTAANGCNEGGPGISVRDYFAIHAPEPTKQQVDDYMSGWNVLDTRLARAELRYLEADAMLKAREGGSS